MQNSTHNSTNDLANDGFLATEHLSSDNLNLTNSADKKQLDKLYSFKNKKKGYRKSYIEWDGIERAKNDKVPTEKTKYISKSAQAVLAVVVQKLQKKEKVFFNHKYLSCITKCKRKQNVRIIKQLIGVLEIKYHTYIRYEGQNYSHRYEFCHKSAIVEVISSTEESIETFETPLTYIHKNNYLKDRSKRGSNFSKKDESKEAEITETPEAENLPKPKTVKPANPSKAKAKPKTKPAKSKKSAKSRLKSSKPKKNGAEPIILSAKKSSNSFAKPKKLKDFHPLSQEDCNELQRRCGRSFALHVMNEILLDMARKGVKAFFYAKKGFMNYMTEVYRREMRDAFKTNNENFKIKANQTPEKQQEEKIEKYLSQIEASTEVSPEWRLKKKFTSVLAPAKSYDLLKAFRSIAVRRGIAKLTLYQSVDLTDHDIGIILSQVKATHESLEGGEQRQIDKVEFIMLEQKPQVSLSGNTQNKAAELPDNLWGTMRRHLISVYEEGIDRSWFSKLEETIDEAKKMIELKAPSSMYESWIRSNYLHTMERIAAEMGVIFKITYD